MKKNKQIPGVSDLRIIPVIAGIYNEDPRTSLIITSTYRKAKELVENLPFFMDGEFLLIPEEETLSFEYEVRSRDDINERLKAVYALIKETPGNPVVVIAPISGVLKKMTPRDELSAHSIRLALSNDIDIEKLKKDLVSSGFERAALTEERGQFSVRGEIVDIFPVDSEYPIRLDIFDTEIETIKTFDPESQRSLSKINEIVIYPAIPPEPKEDGENLTDYLPKDSNLFIDDADRLRENLQKKDEGFPIADYESLFKSNKAYFFTPFANKPDLPVRMDETLKYDIRIPPRFDGMLSQFAVELKRFLKEGYSVDIVCTTTEREKNLKEFIKDQNIEGSIRILSGSLTSGFIIADVKKVILRDGDIFKTYKRKKTGRKDDNAKPIRSFADIDTDDYVVHETHGIGRYLGVEQLTAGGVKRDYLKIKYSGADLLYIPVEQMGIIQKFIGSGNNPPKISKLSGSEWKKAKAKAKKDIAAMSKELLVLSAERKTIGGYAFSEDTVWQKDFEDQFPYTETDDQLRSAESIKRDMERPYPMDRLLCGDVGYGKTEVAARAVFKCAAEGKQAAVLVPTTILASQHFHTFSVRFGDFPFEIEMLSRFRSSAQQSETVKKLESGQVDIVIGTHRLLSKDIKFKDLGLLVIDEEQRFGVKHKEIIKELRKNVDVLTLSATPIPRTLHMSLTGIRDMDLIEEPPEDRYPVQTFVTEENDNIIKDAVRREIDRDGQVYIVYNRVKGIDFHAQMIMDLVPEARVAVGHGQMSEDQLENVMMDFIDGKFNVLISTTIIESGIDIPNVNTMIVIDADKFGLSQLYQLRGRVGRTNRIAYAYLLHKKNKELTEVAEKRLLAIREFTEFGSGFKIAMRDLEIRGAGNLLGSQQSGHMMSIGYELYSKMVEDAVRALQGEYVTEQRQEVLIDLPYSAYIPGTYIEDEQLKLQVYKDIASIDRPEIYEEVKEDIIDRFGQIPEDTETLMKVSLLKSYAEKAGFTVIRTVADDVILETGKNGPGENLMDEAISKYHNRLIRRGKTSQYLIYKGGKKGKIDDLIELSKFFNE